MLHVWILLFVLHLSDGSDIQKVACENYVLEAECGDEEVISFVSGYYGRTNLEPCNDDQRTDWDTNCKANSSNAFLREKCDGIRKCQVMATNVLFGDPCEGTEKYLEMEYSCQPAPYTPSTLSFTTLVQSSSTEAQTTEATEAPSAAALLYCNTQDLRKLDLVTSEEMVLVRDLNRSVVVDYDYARNIIVWTDSKQKSIFSGNMSTGDKWLLVSNVTSYGVAVDWIHGNVYWTDSASDVIDVISLDGLKRKTLFGDLLDEPRGIVLDPREGYMYWSDWGEVPKIEKSGMDGSGRKVIVSAGLKWPNGLAIDLPSRRLFWIEAFHENLCSSDLEGKDVKKIITNSPFLKLPFSIDVFQEWVYWTEWTSNKENIFKANKWTGANMVRVLDGEPTLMGIKVYHSSIQESGPSACGDSNGGCSYLCLPSPGINFTCACPNGKELQPDGRNCSDSPAHHAVLLYCNRHDIRRYDLSTDGDTTVVSGLQRATVIDFHYEKQIIVWTDTDQKKIFRAPVSGMGTSPRVVGDVTTSYGVAVDWLYDHIYWTDTLNNKIDVSDMNGTIRKTLFSNDLDEPRAIVLNPHEGWMWWSDWGEVPKIERSGMDGSHRRVIVSSNIRWPNGLAIDYSLRQLFWVDGKLNILCTVDLDGGNRRTLISSSSLMKHPFSLDVLGEWLFWVEWSSGKESVFKARKADGSHASKVFDGERSLMGLKVFDASKQTTGMSACGEDNGGCSHLCLPVPNADGPTTNFTCACPNTLFLQPDNHNCSSTAQEVFDEGKFDDGDDFPFLLCANVDDIKVINLKTYSDSTLIRDLTRAVSIDYFHKNKTIVWADIREDRICSAPLHFNGLVTELVSDCSHTDGLAVDWLHKNIYWTDKGKDAVEVATLEGKWRRTLFANDLDEPRAIALDPFAGWMFWTDWGRVPKIERAGMDGTDRRVIVSRNVQWPNGVTVDLSLRRIYWADAKTHEICSSTYDGSDRKVILMSWTYLKQPFSIDIIQDDMYWVEWRAGEECVYKADKLTGRNVTKIVDGRKWKNLMGIKVFHSSKQPSGSSRCGDDNGGCSHLCLPTPTSDQNYSCSCPNSLFLALNRRDCLAAAETTTMREIPTEPPPTTGHGMEDDFGILLYANKKDVRTLDLYTSEDNLLADNFRRASAIDFHFEKKIAVWTDSELGQIYSAPLWSGTPLTTLMEGNVTANGVAVDWIHDLIYWTDNLRSSIEVVTMDGHMRKTLLKGGEVDQPRTIVLHPEDGWMFWSDWGRRPKIEKAGMDGSNRMTLIETGVDWTHALTIDVHERRLFWANGDSKKLLSVNFEGSDSRTILHSPDLLHLPFSMDILKNYLYWTEYLPLHESIFRTNKYTGKGTVKVLDRNWSNLMGIKIFHKWKQPKGGNRCRLNVCSHLCLPAPRMRNYTCSCPNGMILSTDGATCTSEGSLFSSSIAPDINTSLIVNEKAALQSGNAGVPIIVGAIATLVLIAVVGVFLYYRQFLHRNIGNIIFNNPVYRKHTEDVNIEKSGRKSLVLLTSDAE